MGEEAFPRTMYTFPYIHDDYAAGLEDTIVHALLAGVFARACNDQVVYLDTHAAAGRYSLHKIRKARQETIHRSCKLFYGSISFTQESLKKFQIHLKRQNHNSSQLCVFPGSPELARSLLRSRRQSMLSEKNPSVYGRLSAFVRRHPVTTVRLGDGFELARGVADGKPNSDKHIVLIDPAYETIDGTVPDYDRLISAICTLGHRSNVIVAATYPSSTPTDRNRIVEMFEHLSQQGMNLAYADLTYRCERYGLRGAGLLVVNGSPFFEFDSSRVLAELRRILRLQGARTRTGHIARRGGPFTRPLA